MELNQQNLKKNMRRQDLEQKTHDFIKSYYNADYNGELIIEQIDDVYSLSLAIPSYMTKTNIGGQFESDKSFLDYIERELKLRNYIRVYFYKIIRIKKEN